MEISLMAELKNYDTFIESYKNEKISTDYSYKGKSILFFAFSNSDRESRYKIAKFLIDEGFSVNCINEVKESLFHILFSNVKHNLPQTEELCKILFEKGADINQIDSQGRHPLQELINMKFTDDELAPLYSIVFSHKLLYLDYKNDWGYSPLDLARKTPYRQQLVKLMEIAMK